MSSIGKVQFGYRKQVSAEATTLLIRQHIHDRINIYNGGFQKKNLIENALLIKGEREKGNQNYKL